MDPMEIKEIADHWQHLRFLKQAVADAQLLYARSLSIVQVSQELLREMDDLSRTNARQLVSELTDSKQPPNMPSPCLAPVREIEKRDPAFGHASPRWDFAANVGE